MQTATKAILTFDDGTPSVGLPGYKATIGTSEVDLCRLHEQAHVHACDPGFPFTGVFALARRAVA